jgi:hypothetical protein
MPRRATCAQAAVRAGLQETESSTNAIATAAFIARGRGPKFDGRQDAANHFTEEHIMATQNQGGSQGQSGKGGSSNERGFAAMGDAQQREIARLGGEAVSEDRAHMAEIGRKGGEASAESRQASSESSGGSSESSSGRQAGSRSDSDGSGNGRSGNSDGGSRGGNAGSRDGNASGGRSGSGNSGR